MKVCYDIIKTKFSSIDAVYNENNETLIIDVNDLEKQFKKIRNIIKILIFEIQSKNIKKNTIIIKFRDADFLNDKTDRLLNIIKLTKTLHYFSIKIKSTGCPEKEIRDKIDIINNKYQGINI